MAARRGASSTERLDVRGQASAYYQGTIVCARCWSSGPLFSEPNPISRNEARPQKVSRSDNWIERGPPPW